MDEERAEPALGTSDEADAEQLGLAQEQGRAFRRTVEHMTQKEAHGATKRMGDYIIGYAVEDAEGMYHVRDGQLVWQDPEEENCHVEVVVLDAADDRFIPELTVHATLSDSQGREVGTHRQPFLWHPWLYHYGRNWRVPGDGEYALRIRVDQPTFMRHDKVNGKRFSQPVEVEFTGVQIRTGQKK